MESTKYFNYLFIILLLVGIVSISGCVQNYVDQTSSGTAYNKPVNINIFTSTKEGNVLRFYFLLEDANGINTVSNGNVKLEIFDELNNTLYTKEFFVKASDFVDYQFMITGQEIGKAYEWRVPISEIKKGVSSFGFGRAVLTFVTPNEKELHAEDTTVEIPTYTEEELIQMAEEEYNKNAITVNKKISKGNFEVTVMKVGFFSPYEYYEKKQYFRVDMEVKNVGGKSDYFSPSDMAILDNKGNQYEYNYEGTLDAYSKIYSGVTKRGYILFDPIPKDTQNIRLVFDLGYDDNYDPYSFEYDISLTN